MSYIKTDEVKKIRDQIKASFPGYKFSITREHHSTVAIAIMEAPIKLTDKEQGKEDINEYHVKEHFINEPEKAAVFTKILDIANQYQRTPIETGDYGMQPTYYVSLSVGQWDKPFKLVAPEKPKENKFVSEGNTFETVQEPAPASKVQIVDYSEKAFAVIGETKPIKDLLMELKGSYNRNLKCGIGWIFSKKRLAAVQEALGITMTELKNAVDPAAGMVQANEEAEFENFVQRKNYSLN